MWMSVLRVPARSRPGQLDQKEAPRARQGRRPHRSGGAPYRPSSCKSLGGNPGAEPADLRGAPRSPSRSAGREVLAWRFAAGGRRRRRLLHGTSTGQSPRRTSRPQALFFPDSNTRALSCADLSRPICPGQGETLGRSVSGAGPGGRCLRHPRYCEPGARPGSDTMPGRAPPGCTGSAGSTPRRPGPRRPRPRVHRVTRPGRG
jgi:hypothetical protein